MAEFHSLRRLGFALIDHCRKRGCNDRRVCKVFAIDKLQVFIETDDQGLGGWNVEIQNRVL